MREPRDLHKPRGGLAGAAAAGLVVGVAANLIRKAAVQTPSILAGNWADALAAEHAATLKLLDALQATGETNTVRRSLLLAQLKHAIGKHALQEENAIYPALREHGLADSPEKLNSEHGTIKFFLFRLSEMPKDDSAWLGVVAELRAVIEPHMREEEQVVFPQLRGKLSDERNKHLTLAMHREGLKLA